MSLFKLENYFLTIIFLIVSDSDPIFASIILCILKKNVDINKKPRSLFIEIIILTLLYRISNQI